MSQIKDWEGCPTTDPHTKRVKVAALEEQLASVEASLRSKAMTTQLMSATPAPGAPGLGSKLDVYA